MFYWVVRGVDDSIKGFETEINPQGPLRVKGLRAVLRWVPVWRGDSNLCACSCLFFVCIVLIVVIAVAYSRKD